MGGGNDSKRGSQSLEPLLRAHVVYLTMLDVILERAGKMDREVKAKEFPFPLQHSSPKSIAELRCPSKI